MKMLMDKEAFARKVESDPDLDCEVRPAASLAETIRTKLLGVALEDQDVVLDDSDWKTILGALANYCPRASWCAPVVDDAPHPEEDAADHAAKAMVCRFEMESMALHKIQRSWLEREIAQLYRTAAPVPRS